MGLPAVKLPGNTNTQTHILIDIHIFIIFEYIYFQARIAAAKKTKRGRAPKKLSEPYSLMTFLETVFDMEPVRSVSSMVSLIVAVVVVSSGNRHILPFDFASDHKVNQKFLSDLLRSIRYASVIVLYSWPVMFFCTNEMREITSILDPWSICCIFLSFFFFLSLKFQIDWFKCFVFLFSAVIRVLNTECIRFERIGIWVEFGCRVDKYDNRNCLFYWQSHTSTYSYTPKQQEIDAEFSSHACCSKDTAWGDVGVSQ